MSQDIFPPDSLEARLDRLRSKMIRGLDGRAASLREASARLVEGDPDARESLRRLGHRLRGSAGSHGLGALGDAGAALEALARSAALDAEVVERALQLAELAERTKSRAPSERTRLSVPPPRDARPPLPADGAGLRILAVDDDESIARLIQLTLGRMGNHETTTLGSAEEALEHIELADVRYDMLLIDTMMPGMSGVDLCEALRAMRAYRAVPLVILSAASPEELGWGARVKAASIDAWLRKPIRMAELVESVNRLRR